jgi:hypothetical protein
MPHIQTLERNGGIRDIYPHHAFGRVAVIDVRMSPVCDVRTSLFKILKDLLRKFGAICVEIELRAQKLLILEWHR